MNTLCFSETRRSLAQKSSQKIDDSPIFQWIDKETSQQVPKTRNSLFIRREINFKIKFRNDSTLRKKYSGCANFRYENTYSQYSVRQQIEKNGSCVCLLCFKNALLNYSNISVFSFLLFSKEILNVSKYFYAPFVRLNSLHFESQLLEVSN